MIATEDTNTVEQLATKLEALGIITSYTIGVEAWETEEGVAGIIRDGGQERESFLVESLDDIEAAAIRAGFAYPDHASPLGGQPVAAWRDTEMEDGEFSASLDLTRLA